MFRLFRSVLAACAEGFDRLASCGSSLRPAPDALLDHASVLAELLGHPVARLVTDLLLDKGFRLTVRAVASLVRARVQAWCTR
ncbi:hypothetical protein [Streptomyces mexicanus]|uniref:hypothetical protein n=1 Tax=Streptomyces mexicanus TaxID=178566 RepID=UPI003665F07C